MTSEIFYDMPAPPVISEPVDVALMETDDSYLINSTTVTNDGQSQNVAFPGQTFPDVYLAANGTGVEIELKSMNPEPELLAEITIAVSDLTLPKQADLAA